MALAILRLPNGLDFSHLTTELVTRSVPEPSHKELTNAISMISSDGIQTPRKLMHVDSNLNLDTIAGSNQPTFATPQAGKLSI